MICPSCGYDNQQNVQFCIGCNTALSSEYSEETNVNPNTSINSMDTEPNIGRLIIIMIAVGVIVFSSFGIGALLYHPNSPFSGEVEIEVTDKFYTWSSSGKTIGLNITFTNNMAYEVSFYTGDFSVMSENGTTYQTTVSFESNPDSVSSGKTVKLQYGFTIGTAETLETITQLVYDTKQYWGGEHHIHKVVDI